MRRHDRGNESMPPGSGGTPGWREESGYASLSWRGRDRTGRVIGVVQVAEVAGVGPAFVRRLEAAGLLAPLFESGEPCYGPEDVARLERAGRMVRELGLNAAGVEVAFHLLDRLEALQRQLARQTAVRITVLEAGDRG